VYYHFWGVLLRPGFEDPEYNNDFASWAKHGLHDQRLAERLGVIDPTDFQDLEQLRREVLDEVEERLDESEFVPWSKPEDQFHFVRSQTVVFDTHRLIEHPRDLPAVVPQLSLGSIFYHVVDARRREPRGSDDFRGWLGQFGDEFAALREQLAGVDPFFTTLAGLRRQLAGIFSQYFQEPARDGEASYARDQATDERLVARGAVQNPARESQIRRGGGGVSYEHDQRANVAPHGRGGFGGAS
jgi:hypothetical protein